MKAVVLRALADTDIDQAIAHFLENGAKRAAAQFIDALEHALSAVAANPTAGSPRIGLEVGIPALRSWSLNGFPYLVLYVEREQHVDVWRVLHTRRDIPNWLD